MESKNNATPNDVISFSMNVPNWFMNESVDTKCNIVENLYRELKDEKPVAREQVEGLLSKK